VKEREVSWVEVQVKPSKRTEVCIIYHPNPDAIADAIEKVREALK
jgi:hypothetical protein